jgi:hypothetical protein
MRSPFKRYVEKLIEAERKKAANGVAAMVSDGPCGVAAGCWGSTGRLHNLHANFREPPLICT